MLAMEEPRRALAAVGTRVRAWAALFTLRGALLTAAVASRSVLGVAAVGGAHGMRKQVVIHS